MAFAFAILKQTVMGDRRVVYGTFTNDTTGGTINTGLRQVENILLQHTGAAAVTESPSVNETLPTDGSIVIVTTSAKSGLWKAIGY
jgi:hypothetical protein